MFPNKQPKIFDYLPLARFVIDLVDEFIPDFETRMINRETKWRRRHAEGKISDARLAIELNAIRQKRLARKQ